MCYCDVEHRLRKGGGELYLRWKTVFQKSDRGSELVSLEEDPEIDPYT